MMPVKPTSIAESLLTSRSSTPKSSQPIEPPGTPPLLGPRITSEQLTVTEDEIAALWNAGELPYLTHLEGSKDGSYERFMCDFFSGESPRLLSHVKPTDWVCASHRCHFAYTLHGGTDLVEQVKRGRSMFLYREKFLNSAIVAGVAPIAVGLGISIKARGGSERVFVFGGDGCENHGHWQEAVIYSWQNNLPVVWIITDNDSSCGVSKIQRNGSDLLMSWPENVIRVQYEPKFPHAGTGEKMTLKRREPRHE